MPLIGCEIFPGKDEGVAGQSATKGVQGYPALAFGSDGALGMGGKEGERFGQ